MDYSGSLADEWHYRRQCSIWGHGREWADILFGDGLYERYDPGTDTWTAIAPPPVYNGWGTVVTCQNKIYVIGGGADVPTQVYDPSTNTWENRTAIPKTILSEQANVVDDKIYVISGGIPSFLGSVTTSDTNYVYDPATDSWSTMAPIPTPVAGYASAVLDGKIYIIGGGTTTVYVENATNLVQIFDPKMNQWTVGKPLPNGVYGAGACATSGLFVPKRIYVVGGNLLYSGGGTSFDLVPKGTTLNQVYDLQTDNWSLAASLPEPRWFCSLVNVNDTLFAVEGLNGSGTSERSPYQAPATVVTATDKYTPIGYEADLFPAGSPSPTSTTDTTSVSAHSATVDMSLTTGVNVTVSGSSLENGTQITIISADLGGNQTSGTSAVSVNDAVFYDVNVTSSSGRLGPDVSATVRISNQNFTSASMMEYWNGNRWGSVNTTFTTPDTVSGNIPASALTGTPILVGTPKSSAFSLLTIIPIVVAFSVMILGLLFVYVWKKKLKP